MEEQLYIIKINTYYTRKIYILFSKKMEVEVWTQKKIA